MKKTPLGKGVLFALASYILWGIFPVYWKLLSAVNPLHILAFRIICSLLLTGFLLLLAKKTAWLSVFRNARSAAVMVVTALALTFNWGLYIWAVNNGHTIEASLGYYINPLISIALGMIFFREKLSALQWAAFAFAAAGVLILTILSGALPWISLGLAFSFGFYGLFKKMIPLSALESLGAETFAAAPLGVFLLFAGFTHTQSDAPVKIFFGVQGLSYLGGLPVYTWFLLALCGAVTALPLYFFAKSARLLPLSALGFTQFINPTFQFALGLFVFGESFPPEHFIAFAFIWSAVILYAVSYRFEGKHEP